jgi:hypothetical protein
MYLFHFFCVNNVTITVLLVANLSLWRIWFGSWSVCVGFVVDKLSMGQIFLKIFQSYPVNIVPQKSHFIFHASTTDVIKT